MDWLSYLRQVVSKTAGAAAGVAATAGGPIAMASARAAAEGLSSELLAQFMGAHADQMQRIEDLSQEIRGRLISLQSSVGALLDGSWHSALAHIEEASRRPSSRNQELELARVRLFEAWGIAKSLLERDARSHDPAALRCPLIAQQIAAVYSFLGEPLNTTHWLATAYTTSRNQFDNLVDEVHDVFLEKMKRARRTSTAGLDIELWSTDPNPRDPLWDRAPDAGVGPSYDKQWWVKPAAIQRDVDFEAYLSALANLDVDAQLLRLACRAAGVDKSILPTESLRAGARQVQRSLDGNLLVTFHPTLSVAVKRPVAVWYTGREPVRDTRGRPWENDRFMQVMPSGTLEGYFCTIRWSEEERERAESALEPTRQQRIKYFRQKWE